MGVIPLMVPPADAARARRLGARARAGLWSHPGPLPRGLRSLAPAEFSPEWFDLLAAGATPHPLPDASVELRTHQREGVEAILAARAARLPGFLLADEVGLGKTFTVIAAVNAMASRRRTAPLRVMVLTPLSVVPHWRRSIRAAGPGNVHWCVTNYDRARAMLHVPESARTAKRTRTRNKRTAAQGRSRVSWDVVILDESHRLKNHTAQRSRAVRQLIETNRQGRRSVPAFALWLSATAGQDPLDLSYLASLLTARDGGGRTSLEEFPRWCQRQGLAVRPAKFGGWEYDPGAGDEEKVRSLLFDPFIPRRSTRSVLGALRRRPTDIAGWPEVQRDPTPVELGDVERSLYDLAWEEFRREMELLERGTEPRSALVAALRFRQKASLLRVAGTARLVRDAVEDGQRPAVSVQFTETAAQLEKALKGLRLGRIDGGTALEERERVRIAFQRGDLDVLLFSPTEGISLHAGEAAVEGDETPRVLLVHDLRWSALEMSQIEGRTHRDGRFALARYLYAESTVEEVMVEAVLRKLSTMAGMLGDDRTALDALIDALTR